jgi:hypothetical protein
LDQRNILVLPHQHPTKQLMDKNNFLGAVARRSKRTESSGSANGSEGGRKPGPNARILSIISILRTRTQTKSGKPPIGVMGKDPEKQQATIKDNIPHIPHFKNAATTPHPEYTWNLT